MTVRTYLGCALAALLLLASPVAAQIELATANVKDTISSNGDSVTLLGRGVGGFGSVKVQTLDSYSGTWEVQCALDGTNFDAASELKLTASDDDTVLTAVTDTVGIWDVSNAAGCSAIRVISTAGFAATDTVVVIAATQTGGTGGGGGGASGEVSISQTGSENDVDLASAIPAGANQIGLVGLTAGDNDVGNVDLELAGTAVAVTNPVATRLSDGANFLDIADSSCADEDDVTSVAIDTASAGNVELVALTTDQIVYVCGYTVVASGAVSVQFIYGTGAACATGETDITGPMAFAANGGDEKPNAGSVQFKTAASNALCIELSGAVQVSGLVTYVKK